MPLFFGCAPQMPSCPCLPMQSLARRCLRFNQATIHHIFPFLRAINSFKTLRYFWRATYYLHHWAEFHQGLKLFVYQLLTHSYYLRIVCRDEKISK